MKKGTANECKHNKHDWVTETSVSTFAKFVNWTLKRLRYCGCHFIGARGRKCLFDETVPEYPVNVYYCNDSVKTECCAVDKQAQCCEPTDSTMM